MNSYGIQQIINNFLQLFQGRGVFFTLIIAFVIVVIVWTIRLLWWNFLLLIPPIRHLAQAIMRKLMGND